MDSVIQKFRFILNVALSADRRFVFLAGAAGLLAVVLLIQRSSDSETSLLLSIATGVFLVVLSILLTVLDQLIRESIGSRRSKDHTRLRRDLFIAARALIWGSLLVLVAAMAKAVFLLFSSEPKGSEAAMTLQEVVDEYCEMSEEGGLLELRDISCWWSGRIEESYAEALVQGYSEDHVWSQFFERGSIIYNHASNRCVVLFDEESKYEVVSLPKKTVSGGDGNKEVKRDVVMEMLKGEDSSVVAQYLRCVEGFPSENVNENAVRGSIGALFVRDRLYSRLGGPVGTEYSPRILWIEANSITAVLNLNHSYTDEESKTAIILDSKFQEWHRQTWLR